MKREVLDRLVAAKPSDRPAVLVRAITGDHQLLLDDEGAHGDTAEFPAEIVQQARAWLRRDDATTLEADGERFLVQTFSSPPRLIIVGAVHIAQALIPIARVAGFDVKLIDPRPAFGSAERFPGIDVSNEWPAEAMQALSLDGRTAVMTLSHDAKIDEPALIAALNSEAFYIGALGSRKNHAKRLERLAEHGYDEPTLARISGPIGLPLGGRSPAEIAVAILAEVIQSRYRDEKS